MGVAMGKSTLMPCKITVEDFADCIILLWNTNFHAARMRIPTVYSKHSTLLFPRCGYVSIHYFCRWEVSNNERNSDWISIPASGDNRSFQRGNESDRSCSSIRGAKGDQQSVYARI